MAKLDTQIKELRSHALASEACNNNVDALSRKRKGTFRLSHHRSVIKEQI